MRNPPDRTACANVRWPVHTRAMAPASAVMTRSTSCPGSFKHTSTPSRSSVRCLTNPRLRVRIARNREGRCMAAELHDLSIAELSTLIAARKLSPVELTDALIRRIEDYDAQTHAFLTRTFELARRQARDAEAEIAAGTYRGALHGIPFALKDIYDTAGILTSGHSRVFMDRIPREDATATRKLYEAGAILLGKLATHEMAHAGPSFDLPWPPARNPWNLERFTGGSSTGSGAAVAAGMVPVALDR